MTAKEQKIKEAYVDKFDKYFPDENGWSSKYVYEWADVLDNDFTTISVAHGIYKVRPKSLQGIENNNGWIRIESEEDLPKRDGLFYLFGEGGVGMGRFCELQNIFKTFNGNIYTDVTHYQPIVKPELPIY